MVRRWVGQGARDIGECSSVESGWFTVINLKRWNGMYRKTLEDDGLFMIIKGFVCFRYFPVASEYLQCSRRTVISDVVVGHSWKFRNSKERRNNKEPEGRCGSGLVLEAL